MYKYGINYLQIIYHEFFLWYSGVSMDNLTLQMSCAFCFPNLSLLLERHNLQYQSFFTILLNPVSENETTEWFYLLLFD